MTAIDGGVLERAVGRQLRALLVDDSPQFSTSIRGAFVREGYVLDVAIDTESALRQIDRYSYDVVVIDIVLGDRITGDEFIVANWQSINRATVVAITANTRAAVANLSELENLGVEVLEKGDHLPALKIALRAARQRAEAPTADPAAATRAHEQQSMVGFDRVAGTWGRDLLESYLASLRAKPDQDAKHYCFGEITLNARELAHEVEIGSSLGLEHLKLIGKALFRRLGARDGGAGR